MNNIFEKNLSMMKDKALAEDLAVYEYAERPILTTTNGYNVMYNGEYLHSQDNPLSESLSIFQRVKNGMNNIHIIYGLGLGYLFQIAVKESKGMVVLYEPNLDILHNAFTFVDFTQELSQPNVHLFTDFEKLKEFLVENINNETDIEILSLDSYRKMYDDVFTEHTKQLELLYGSVLLDYGFKNKRIPAVTLNILRNIPRLIQETPINVLENSYTDKTAIIVSAGPTLQENIEALKKYQDNAIIFAVGPALKTLVKHNIKVDYLCIIESINCSKQVKGLDLSDMNLIMEPYTNPAIHALEVKNKYLHISSNMPPNAYFSEMANVDTQNYFTMGTVSYMALNTAVNLKFGKIILVGQDLAYIDGQCYSKDSAYENLACKFNPETNKYEIMADDIEKFADVISVNKSKEKRMEVAQKRLKNLNSVLYSVKSIDGKMVPTEAGYASFIQHFENYVKDIEGVEFINTSLKGALIKGFENKSLDEAMAGSDVIEKQDLSIKYDYDTDKIYNELSSLLKTFKEYSNSIDECGKLVSRLTMDLKRNKTVDKEKLLKIRKLIETYTLMDNTMFKYITVQEDSNLESYLKTVHNYTETNTPQVVAKLKEYYELVRKRTTSAVKILSDVLQEVEKIK